MTTKPNRIKPRGRGKRPRVYTPTDGVSRTKQSFKQECDINHLMESFTRTGVMTHLNEHKPHYGFAPAIDFKKALDTVLEAETIFADLPSALRTKFSNDPGEFLAFVEDPDNRSEMALMGLLNPEATQEEAAKKEASDSASAPVPPAPETAPTPE